MGLVLWGLVAVAAALFLFFRLRHRPSADRGAEVPAASDAPTRRRALVAQSVPGETPAASAPSAGIEETVSVVLRRQIPPREETPRSWLGGLPMLPDEVEWPRGVNPEKPAEGEVPLHFIAQVCCADLPAELWGGLGPREGWMLLFVNGNTCEQDDRGVWRILHTAELGSERQPPEDIGVIHDGVYTGGNDWTSNHTAYPRWPVDCLVVPNQLRIEEGRSLAAPEDFETVLYPEMPVERSRHKLPALPPISRRALANGLRTLAAQLSTDLQRHAVDEQTAARFAEPENFALASTVPGMAEEQARERRIARLREELGEDATDEAIAERLGSDGYLLGKAEERAEIEALFAEAGDAAGVIARVERDHEDFLAWRGEAAEWIAEWCDELAAGPLDEPLGEQHQALADMLLAAPPHRRWVVRGEGGLFDLPRHTGLARVEFSLAKQVSEAWANASRDIAVPYYLDPALRPLIPEDALPAFEAHWRSLYSNRPHRIGGYHDGLQSDAQPGPQTSLLLIQVATDDAMFFCWGDAGAVYAFIDPAALDRGELGQGELYLECH
jgi:hypothetical protein